MPSPTRRGLLLGVIVVGATVAAVPATAAPGEPVPPGAPLAQHLVRSVDGAGVERHLDGLQQVADRHAGNRASGTPGFDASVEFLARPLRAAGFEVSTPEFSYDTFHVDAHRLTVGGADVASVPMTFSPSTGAEGVNGALVVAPEDGSPGCEIADYANLPVAGNIVLVRRGLCPFAQKQQVAADAGAVAVLISNTEPGPLRGTLGTPAAGRVPTVGLSKLDGDTLLARAGTPTTLVLQTRIERRTSRNVIAQTRTGRTDNVVMAGAHLDSVPEGPGINDNGTGTAALLETALRLGPRPQAQNAVRFAWWGAEEKGLVGSEAYVVGLDEPRLADIALYLNFDMIGSPNAAYFVYDGDDSDRTGAGPGPEGSGSIERTFTGFLASRRVPTEGTDFNGRSDYGPFIAAGIPAGGLFTGAEGIKTPEQVVKWGGRPGVAFDPCYHQACDNRSNVDPVALERNADALAWTIGVYAASTDGPAPIPPRAMREPVPAPVPAR